MPTVKTTVSMSIKLDVSVGWDELSESSEVNIAEASDRAKRLLNRVLLGNPSTEDQNCIGITGVTIHSVTIQGGL